jgi:hypothetical protein
MKRSREGESNIPLEYLENCNNYHNNMLNVNLDDCVCDEQLILDGNIDIYENADQLVKWINEIEGFIRN